jgi:hypothetical protein
MQWRRKACRNLIYSRIKQELLISMCQKSNNRTVNFHILNGKNRQRSTILPEKMSTRFPPHYLIREILTEIGAPKRIFFSEIWFMMHEVNCGLKCGHLKTLLCTRTYFQMVNYLIKPLRIHDGSLSPFFFKWYTSVINWHSLCHHDRFMHYTIFEQRIHPWLTLEHNNL